MDKYEWLPSESAYTSYPMEIVKGALTLKDGGEVQIPSHKVVNNGWGEIGSTHIVGDRLKHLPTDLTVTWFSYTEDKFYGGTFSLPYQRISQLFKEGLTSPNGGGHITFQRILVGLAPEGDISIWIAAEGVVLEVAQFTANESGLSWKALLDNEEISRKEYIATVLEEALTAEQIAKLERQGIPKALSTYHRQYPWGLEVTGTVATKLWLKTLNGEKEFFDFRNDKSRATRALPKAIEVHWSNRYGNYMAEIRLDEDEVIRCYRKLLLDAQGHQLKLQLEVNEHNPSVNVMLKSTNYVLQLQRTTVKVYAE